MYKYTLFVIFFDQIAGNHHRLAIFCGAPTRADPMTVTSQVGWRSSPVPSPVRRRRVWAEGGNGRRSWGRGAQWSPRTWRNVSPKKIPICHSSHCHSLD